MHNLSDLSERETLKHRTFLGIAAHLARLSTCDRKYVGAVIVRNGRCVTWGFNGAPPGLPHCNENWHGWESVARVARTQEADYYAYACQMVEEEGCRNATHAEANALAFAARQGISTDEGTLYVTVSPCVDCARLLIASGIQRVFAIEEYRDPVGVELLQEVGTLTSFIEPI
jgi:dCMP deaminase